jgi:hypothetical protein
LRKDLHVQNATIRRQTGIVIIVIGILLLDLLAKNVGRKRDLLFLR